MATTRDSSVSFEGTDTRSDEMQSTIEQWIDDLVAGVDESCTSPDWQQRSPEGGCKHLRRVDHEIKRGRVPRPDCRLPANAD